MKEYRFVFLNANLHCPLLELADQLGDVATSLLNPASIVAVDESMFEFQGECSCKRYIPRKPHPNGLLAYAISSYVHVGVDKIPVVLWHDPYIVGHLVTAQEAMVNLFNHLNKKFPATHFHVVADSAFGNKDKALQLKAASMFPLNAKDIIIKLILTYL